MVTEKDAQVSKTRGRVLIVEDEPLIAMSLEDQIADFGYEVVGTAPSADAALARIESQSPDIVLLDLFLRDRLSWELADLLLERQVPFVIMSGSPEEIPPRYAGTPRLKKPFPDRELEKALRSSAGLSRVMSSSKGDGM